MSVPLNPLRISHPVWICGMRPFFLLAMASAVLLLGLWSLALAAGWPLMARRLHAQGVLEQRALVVEGVKKLLKQQASPSQLAEAWKTLPMAMLFDWFCDWAQLMLRYQLSRDEEGLGAVDMRKVVQYLADKTPQHKLLAMQDWLLQQRQKVLGKANLNGALLLEALLVQWASLPGPG